MPSNDASVVLVHGAWADGSSWSPVIGPLAAAGTRVVADHTPGVIAPSIVVSIIREALEPAGVSTERLP